MFRSQSLEMSRNLNASDSSGLFREIAVKNWTVVEGELEIEEAPDGRSLLCRRLKRNLVSENF